MNTLCVRFFLALCISLTCVHVIAQDQDGNKFLKTCSAAIKSSEGAQLDADESAGALFCVAYIYGYVDAMTLTTKFTKGKPDVCLPERGISNDQAIRVFVKYLRENPAILHETGRTSLYIALEKVFPCRP